MVPPPPASDLANLAAVAFDSGRTILLAGTECLFLAGGDRPHLRRAVCGRGGLGARLCASCCETRIR